MTLDAFKTSLKKENIFEKYNIEKIGIFGSIARGEDGNDIDILADDTDFKKWIKLKEELEPIIKVNLDIVIEKYANPIVLMRAKKEIVYITKCN